MSIDIIIPNYNGFLLLTKNLPLVLESLISYKDISIIIVDDGSSSDEKKKLESYIEEIKKGTKIPMRLIFNEKNRGFSSAVNRGAWSSTADLLVFLNTDIVPEKKFLDPILEDFTADEKLFGVGCMDKSIENGRVVLRGRGIGKWERGFLVHARGEIDDASTLWVSGGSSAVRRHIFLKLGGFDTLFNPFYWEDIDLSYRAQKAGYHTKFEKNSIVIHHHEEGSIRKHYNKSQIKVTAYRNQFIFIWKNITDAELTFSHLLWLPYQILKALMRGDTAFIMGLFLALAHFPAIIKKRFQQKKIFIRSDRDILSQF